jgi:hypothetical protein
MWRHQLRNETVGIDTMLTDYVIHFAMVEDGVIAGCGG